MKTILLVLVLSFATLTSYSQISFEKFLDQPKASIIKALKQENSLKLLSNKLDGTLYYKGITNYVVGFSFIVEGTPCNRVDIYSKQSNFLNIINKYNKTCTQLKKDYWVSKDDRFIYHLFKGIYDEETFKLTNQYYYFEEVIALNDQ